MQISQKSKVNQPYQAHQPWQSNSLTYNTMIDNRDRALDKRISEETRKSKSIMSSSLEFTNETADFCQNIANLCTIVDQGTNLDSPQGHHYHFDPSYWEGHFYHYDIANEQPDPSDMKY